MTKVYVVTAGQYSDHHVVAVCATEAVASEMVDKCYGDYYDEYELNVAVPRPHTHQAWVDLLTGDLVAVKPLQVRSEAAECGGSNGRLEYPYSKYYYEKDFETEDRAIVQASGVDEESAIKNAHDYRASIVALGDYRSNPAPHTVDDFLPGCRVSFYNKRGEKKFGRLEFEPAKKTASVANGYLYICTQTRAGLTG